MRDFQFEIKEQEFYVNGKKEWLLCGEIHYFRMDKEVWEKALDKLVACGCNAVAYYVPWFVHEYREGCFDFEGKEHPSNNLIEWLELTVKKGLMGIFRPGPYVYAECTDLGIPGWFQKKYPNAQVQQYRDGEYRNSSTIHVVGHNHPDFLAATRKWYQAVCQVMKPYLAPRGNIVMVQLCNEIPADDHNDHNRENLGIGDEQGRYPRFLRQKYQSLEKLNRQYQTGFTAFEKVEPYMLERACEEQATLDRLEFYYNHYYPEYFRTLRGYMVENGVNTQFCHNAYNPRAISLHVENNRQNPWLEIGIDCYFSLNGCLNLKDLSYYCEYGAEYSRRFLQGAPFVLEQECGYWHDYPVVHGPELYIWNIWTMAAGYKGFNMYLFASGENRPGMGFYGTSHNWQAPVDKNGEERPCYKDICRSIEAIKAMEETLRAENVYDVWLGVKNDPGLIWKPLAKTTDEAYVGLRGQGYTPRLCDIQGAEDWMQAPVLVVAADERMDENHQSKLLEYLKRGGRLLLCGAVPTREMNGNPCQMLARGAGLIAGEKANTPADQQIVKMADREYYTGTALQEIQAGGAAQLLAVGRSGEAAVWKVQVGEGTLITAPFQLKIVMRDTALLLRELLELLGAKPPVEGQKMLRVLHKENGKSLVVNLHPVEIQEDLRIQGKDYTMQMDAYSVAVVE